MSGSQIRLLNSETKPVDETLIQRFATMTPSITERPLDDSRVDYITTKVVEGLAVPFHWAFAKLDGETFRVNGQHSSHALAQMNGNLPEGLVVHIDEYAVNDQADLITLFRQFDPRKSSRTPEDVANAYASTVPGLAGLPTGTVKLGAEGIVWGFANVDRLPAMKADDRYIEILHPQNLDFLQWLAGLISIKTPELRTLAVVAAMHKTHLTDLERSKAFWEDVAKGGDLDDETDPATALDTWLRRVKDRKDRTEARPPQIYQACIFCWNAHVDGKKVGKINFDTAKGFLDPKYPA